MTFYLVSFNLLVEIYFYINCTSLHVYTFHLLCHTETGLVVESPQCPSIAVPEFMVSISAVCHYAHSYNSEINDTAIPLKFTDSVT